MGSLFLLIVFRCKLEMIPDDDGDDDDDDLSHGDCVVCYSYLWRSPTSCCCFFRFWYCCCLTTISHVIVVAGGICNILVAGGYLDLFCVSSCFLISFFFFKLVKAIPLRLAFDKRTKLVVVLYSCLWIMFLEPYLILNTLEVKMLLFLGIASIFGQR